MKFINEAYDNGFLAGQNDIIENRILDEFPYPEINSNNPDLLINQEDYGNYMVNNENNNENNQENNDDSMNDDEEDMDQYKYLGVKNLRLNVNVSDPDIDPNIVHRCFNDIPEVDRDKLSISFSILPNLKPKENINDPDIRYTSMRQAVIDLERRIVKISPDDLQYYGPGIGIQEPNYRYIELNYPNLYIGFSKLMLYLENLYDARKLVNDVIYPPEYSLNNRNYKSGIIPYNNPVNNENNIIILPPQGYDYMDKVITSLNLREINLPYKVLELVYGQYYKYNYNISEVEEIEENEKFIPNTGIKNFDFNLRKIVADSRTVDSETHRLKLTEEDKSGFDYYFNNVQRHMNPVIGFTDDILVLFENRNYYHEIDLTANNDKVRVHKLPRILPPEPVPENNSKRIKTTRGEEDPIESEYGITNYDMVKKVYNNYHLYTIEKENAYRDDLDPGSENYALGFKSVMQTTEIPIIDNVRLDEVRNNGLLTYSIDDFNDSYSLEAGSKNPYANDFIGFNQIQIPIKINNKVVPGFGSTPNIYRPSDFDPDAIGFSSFQIQGTSNSGGSGGDSEPGSVNNLEGYTFNHNTSEPYTIEEYNDEFNTNYTGFNNINVNVGELESLNIKLNRIGNYSVNFNNGLVNIIPVMNSDNDNGIIVSCSDYYDNGYLPYKAFDNNMGTSYGSARPPVKENWLKVQLDEEKEVDFVRMWLRSDRYVDTILFSGSNDDVDYVVLSDITSINYSVANDGNKYFEFNIRSPSKYLYYKFFFTYSTVDFEIREINLMKYSGGYSNVHIDIDTGDLLLSANKTIDTIENNVTNVFTPVDYIQSFVPIMSSNNSGGAEIFDIVNGHGNAPWRLFDNNNGTYYELGNSSLPGSFILKLDTQYVLRSFYIFCNTENNFQYSLGKLIISGSNNNEDYILLYKNENIIEDFTSVDNWNSTLYENVDNEDSYMYYKIECEKYNTGSYLIWNTLRLYSEHKYIGFNKLTVVNNTYSKTSNPVVGELQPSNQRVYVNTDDYTIHPYVRRNWMTVPLEDKVIDYNGIYVPTNITTSSGYYGIKSITFNNTNEGIISCSKIFNNTAVSTDVVNDWYVNGNYSCQMQNSDGSIFYGNNDLIWQMFNGLLDGNGVGNTSYNCYYVIKSEYPFIMNGFRMHMGSQWGHGGTDTVYVYVSNDGFNWNNIYTDNYHFGDNQWTEVKFYSWMKKYRWYKLYVGSLHIDEIELFYCSSGSINSGDCDLYPNYEISVNQPGVYYYNPPIGYDGIQNIILNVGASDIVQLNKYYIKNLTEVVRPPEGKSYISEVNVTVDVQSNTINRSSSIDVNDNRYKIELDVSGDQILEYKYLYKINNPSSKSINIYYRYFGDNSSNVNILTNVNSVKYELFVQTEADKTYIYCYNYVNNVKTYISKTEVNKLNLFVLGIENYNNNENLNNCSFVKEIEVGKNNDIITDNPINNNSNSVEIGINNNPSSSSGVIVNTSSTTKGVNVYVRDRSNNDVSVASNVTGSFRVWVYRIPDDDDNVEVEVIDDNGHSYESHILPKSSVSKIVTSMYDSNDNFIGYETKVWNSYYSDVTFRPNTDDSVKEISEIPDYDNDFGGTGMTGLSDDALKSIVEDFNHRNDNFVDYMSVQRDQSNTGSNVNNFNEFLRDIYTPLMNGTNWNYSKLQAELTSRGISYSVSTNTITNGFPYGESGVREWAFVETL